MNSEIVKNKFLQAATGRKSEFIDRTAEENSSDRWVRRGGRGSINSGYRDCIGRWVWRGLKKDFGLLNDRGWWGEERWCTGCGTWLDYLRGNRR